MYQDLCMLLLIMSISTSLNADNKSGQTDWMINASPYQAQVTTRAGNLVISNGLVERIFHEGVTVSLNNLMTGEGMLRSIRPEAELVLDQIHIPVGNLTGQPIHNYILPEWIKDSRPDSTAFEFKGYEVSEIEKRFDWKPRTEWMSSHPAWPPKGKVVTLKFQANDRTIRQIASLYGSDENRPVLLDENFSILKNTWKIHTSPSNGGNAFNNEGKPAEMLIQANTSAYAEHVLDPATEIVITRVNPGTDQAATWGPGMAWGLEGKTVKFYIRTGENKFGVTGTGLEYESTFDGVKKGLPVYLKMRKEQDVISCSYSYDNKKWELVTSVRISKNALSRFIKVGKMDGNAENKEAADKGEAGRSRIEMVKALGKLPSASTTKEQFDYLKQIEVNIHYEIYDHIPLLCKWVSVVNQSGKSVTLNSYKSEILAVMEPENTTVFNRSFQTPNITVETDMVHCNKQDRNDPYNNQGIQHHVHWKKDNQYTTQVDWLMNIPCLLESYPEYGPEHKIKATQTFDSHRTWELFHDSWERERKTLQVRKMYRTAAPWVAENPIFMHVRMADNESVKKAIDQCAEVGFEMVIMTFGSGVNMEDASPKNLERMKMLADYAHSKGIALGGYSLLASRSIDKENDVVMPEGKTPMFGASPCIESQWGQNYMKNLATYFETTGQDILEHDGSYPGDECASENHPGHKGLEDSQWNQYKTIQSFYHTCKSNGIFLNIPDWYFMNGQNKTGMGYRETNWSLPREQQEIIERQNIYDGTWMKAPSMGWMMVPLVEYHGGGKAATIEPLREHLPHYECRLANNFGAGVIACYRGPQLYDSEETKQIVRKWVNFYKENRDILDSDLIHLRRPDGIDWDGFIHVNPALTTKGLMMLYNPLDTPIKKMIKVPLYYTGLTQAAWVKEQDGAKQQYTLNRDYTISLEIEIPARGYNWYTFE